jgi:hypothetical protein
LAIDVLVARAGDPTTETLILSDDATRKPVWAIRDGDARYASVGAGVVLARETRHAIVGIVAAAWDRSKAPADLEVADVVGVTTVADVLASPAPDDEAALKIITAVLEAYLAHRTGVVVVAEVFLIRTRRATRAGATTGLDASVRAPVGNAAVRATLTPVEPAVQIDARIATSILERGGSGITTASRRRSGQQHVSKGSHDQGRRPGSRAMERSASSGPTLSPRP